MTTSTTAFVRKRRAILPMKYMRRSLRTIITRNPKSTIRQLSDIDKSYRKFIETPLEGASSGD